MMFDERPWERSHGLFLNDEKPKETCIFCGEPIPIEYKVCPNCLGGWKLPKSDWNWAYEQHPRYADPLGTMAQLQYYNILMHANKVPFTTYPFPPREL